MMLLECTCEGMNRRTQAARRKCVARQKRRNAWQPLRYASRKVYTKMLFFAARNSYIAKGEQAARRKVSQPLEYVSYKVYIEERLQDAIISCESKGRAWRYYSAASARTHKDVLDKLSLYTSKCTIPYMLQEAVRAARGVTDRMWESHGEYYAMQHVVQELEEREGCGSTPDRRDGPSHTLRWYDDKEE